MLEHYTSRLFASPRCLAGYDFGLSILHLPWSTCAAWQAVQRRDAYGHHSWVLGPSSNDRMIVPIAHGDVRTRPC